jgi:hypothetical protein
MGAVNRRSLIASALASLGAALMPWRMKAPPTFQGVPVLWMERMEGPLFVMQKQVLSRDELLARQDQLMQIERDCAVWPLEIEP